MGQYSSLCQPGDTCLSCWKCLIQPLRPLHTHCHNEDFCCSCLSGCSPKCPFTSSAWHADLELSRMPLPHKDASRRCRALWAFWKGRKLGGTHMIPEGGVGQNVEIENVNT